MLGQATRPRGKSSGFGAIGLVQAANVIGPNASHSIGPEMPTTSHRSFLQIYHLKIDDMSEWRGIESAGMP